MDLKGTVDLVQGKYVGKVTVQIWESFDNTLFSRYGEPTVQTGGDFAEGAIEFSLTENLKYIYSDSPHTQSFSLTEFQDAGDRAVLWMNTLMGRIETKMLDFRSNDATNYKGTLKIRTI